MRPGLKCWADDVHRRRALLVRNSRPCELETETLIVSQRLTLGQTWAGPGTGRTQTSMKRSASVDCCRGTAGGNVADMPTPSS